VFAGPDHLAVLAPFSVEAGRRAWVVGLRWGVGHASGLLCVAAAAWFLREAFDPGLLERASGPLIGFVLVAVGVWGLLHARGSGHVHSGPPGPRRGAGQGEVHVHATAALLVGTLHGVVGTGGVLAVVPVLGMGSGLEAASYLGGFGAGTVGAMVGAAALLGRIAPRTGSAYRRVFVAAALAALAVGVLWLSLAALGVDLHAHG